MGTAPERVEYSYAELTDTTYDAAFESAWSAPEPIVREIARRHPGLAIRFTALEEGNEHTFVLTSKDGLLNEEQPPITDEFIDEVEGTGEAESRVESE